MFQKLENVKEENNLLKMLFILSPLVFSFALALDIYIPLVPKMIDIMYTTKEKIHTFSDY